MDKEILFSERQCFRKGWLWIILLGVNGLFISGLIKQVILEQQFGNNPMSSTGLIIITIVVVVCSFLFFLLRLGTHIKKDEIYVRFSPFQLKYKYYLWNNLKQVFIRQYSPIMEYGGWGLRGFRKNKALTVSGNTGIQFVIQDDSRILIGTNKTEKVVEILKKLGYLTA